MKRRDYLCCLALSVHLLVGQLCHGQLKAGFTANSFAGCVPLTVQFQDTSSGSPRTWKWDLGNGTISFFQNPSTVYFNPGVYTVKLVVSDSTGSDSVVRLRYITVYSNPKPGFAASDSVGCFPLRVQFTDLTVAPDINNPVNQWKWDFGDGNTSTLQNPEHTYFNAGDYPITMQVATEKGCRQTAGRQQFIRITPGVKAAFTDTTNGSCRAPLGVSFFNGSSGPGTLTYNWDFGDGSSSSQKDPQHVYNVNGTFTARLVAVSSAGCRDTLIKPALFSVGNNIARFTSPDKVCTGEILSISNTSTPPPLSVKWDFGDGGSSTAQDPIKSYSLPGTYVIRLVDVFPNCVDSARRQVQVLARPVVSFNTTDLYSCKVPFSVHFTSNAVAGARCLWDFGDGATGTDPNPVHVYTVFGLFTVRLVITGVNGCTDTLVRASYIRVDPPKITVTGLPAGGCLPFTITPVANVQVSDNVVEYRWDFGDGTGSSLAAPSKTYTVAGDYTVKLVVRTAGGCIDSVVIVHAAQASTKPVVNFSANPLLACRSVQIRFTNLSIPAGDKWEWNFGDGVTSSVSDPTHFFGDTGYFRVRLVVWNKGCSDTLKIDSFVHIDPPVARFRVVLNCQDKFNRVFRDSSIAAQSMQWDFGDGATGAGSNPSHRYAQPGVYRVKLTVTHDACVDSSIQAITIADEHPAFVADQTEICKKNAVVFTLSGLDPFYTKSIIWDPGDGVRVPGGAAAINSGKFSHVYTRSGSYTVSLTSKDLNGCTDSVRKAAYVRVNGPLSDFGVPQKVCVRSNIVWVDRSVGDGVHAIAKWVWNYGDGTVQTYSSSPFEHAYASGGIYTVKLVITDVYGCMDSITKMVTVADPRAMFAASDTSSCPNRTVSFSNSSTGGGLSWQWDFGDGGRSSLASPVHNYVSPGIYAVNLLIVDSVGCRDSLQHTVRISVPVAGYDLSDSTGSCPPLQVKFTNRSQNYTGLQWSFGDGAVSSLLNPIHFYNFPGTYFAKVFVRGPGGCADSMIRKIVILGPQGSLSYSPTVGCKPLKVDLRASTQGRQTLIWDFNDGGTSITEDTVISYTYSFAGSFLPKLILIDSAGCKVVYAGTDTIHVVGVTALAEMDTYRICDSGFVQFTDRSVANDFIVKETWDFGDGTGSLQANPRHYYNVPGILTVKHTVTTGVGCEDSISLADTIKIYQRPGASIIGDSAACVPGILDLRSGPVRGDSANLSWLWDFGDGQTSVLPDPGPRLYPFAGSYRVSLQVLYANYCSSVVMRGVNIWPLPNTFAGVDTFICEGHPILLQATGADTYIWNAAPGDPPPAACMQCADLVVAQAVDADYVVTGFSVNGCVRRDSVHVRARHPFTIAVLPIRPICAGQSVILSASGTDQYQWLPVTGLDDPNAAMTRASPGETTQYKVTGNDDDHCFSDSADILLVVFPVPKVSAGNDTTVITGSEFQLHTINSADVSQWNWVPATGLSCYVCADPAVTVTSTITYRVLVTNAGGCSSSDTITIHSVCNDNNWFVPNSFSPNGDGMNDVFYVRGKGLNTVQSMSIFNRWGQVIFERRNFPPNDPSVGWDGTYSGNRAPMDTYIYLIQIVCNNSTIISYHGNVTLIR